MAEIVTKFKVGDRVKCIKEYDDNKDIVGKVGTIREISLPSYIVEFDNEIEKGHNGFGVGKKGYCWNFNINKAPQYLEPYKDPAKSEKLIIYVDKDFVVHAKHIATDGSVMTAKATPQKDDTFNFFTGVNVAVMKLAKKRLKTCKTVMLKSQFDKIIGNIEVI